MKNRDLKSRKLLYTTVYSQCFSPCGKYLAAANSYGDIAIFSLSLALAPEATPDSWNPFFSFKASDQGAIYSLSSTEQFLVSAGDGDICGWKWSDILAKAPRIVWTLTLPKSTQNATLSTPEINSLAIDQQEDGSIKLFAGGGDNMIHTWDLHTGQRMNSLSGHKDYIHSLALRSNGQECLSASEDGSVRIWDTRVAGEAVHIIEPYKNEELARPERGKWLGCIAVDNGGDDWMLCGGGPKLSLWRLKSLTSTTVFNTPKSSQKTVMFYQDTIISAGSCPEINHWYINGDLKSQVPTSSCSIYSVAANHLPSHRVLTVAGNCSKIDVCTNLGYKAFSFNFIPCS